MNDLKIVDNDEVIRALNILHGGKPFEFRVLGKGKPHTRLFDKAPDAVQWLSGVPLEGRAAYVSLNEISSSSLANSSLKALKDSDIARYVWLFVDVDPERPAGTNSNESELKAAADVAQSLVRFMCDTIGFNQPLVAMSGNGYHTLWRVDLPNNDSSKKLVKTCLSVLDELFSSGGVKIDTAVCNPARMTKLYGTVPQSKKASEDRPHRMSRILQEGSTDINPIEFLQALAALKKPPEKDCYETPKATRLTRGGNNFDAETFLIKHGIAYAKKHADSKHKYKFVLEQCPFNPEHTAPDAAVFVGNDDSLGFKCFHNSCSDKHWKEFRLFFEPDAYDTEAFTGVKAGQDGVKNKWGKFFDTDEGYTCYEEWTGKGQERHLEAVVMCKATIQINRILKSVSEGGKRIVDLTVVSPSGARTPLQVPAADLLTMRIQNYAGILPLAAKKAVLFTEYFDERLNNEENLQGIQMVDAVPSMGWYRGEFIPYSNKYMLNMEAASDETCEAIAIRGTIEKWIEAVRPVREKSEAVRLTLAASLASVLLEPFNMQGFTCHIEGETGIGKTRTIMNTVASVWGDPRVYVKGFNATENAMNARAAVMKNLPLVLDEIMTVKSRRGDVIGFDSLVYQLSQGVERLRLNADSSQRDIRKWALISFFAGEINLTDDNSEAGADNRIIRIQATREELEGTNIVEALYNNHGHVGRAFVEWLQGLGLDGARGKFEEAARKLKTECKGFGVAGKQMQAYCFIVFADMYLSQGVFRDKIPHDYVACAKRHLKTDKEISKAEKAYKYLMGKIAENQEMIIGDLTNPDKYPKTIIGKRKDGNLYIIMSWANGQLDRATHGAVGRYLKDWYKAGYLVRDTRKSERIGEMVTWVIMFKGMQGVDDSRVDVLDDIPF